MGAGVCERQPNEVERGVDRVDSTPAHPAKGAGWRGMVIAHPATAATAAHPPAQTRPSPPSSS
eukprot:1531203-Pyramimonas_sp.AAC.1